MIKRACGTAAEFLLPGLPSVARVAHHARCGRLLIRCALRMTPRHTANPAAQRRIQSLADRRALAAIQRLAALKRFTEGRLAGNTWREATRLAGVSPASISRYSRALSEGDLAGLEPKLGNAGRKSEFEKFHVPDWCLVAVERIAISKGCGVSRAWKSFAETAECPPTIAARVRQGVPESFVRAIRLRTVRVVLGQHIAPSEALALATQQKENNP
jgi:hypothetical protein